MTVAYFCHMGWPKTKHQLDKSPWQISQITMLDVQAPGKPQSLGLVHLTDPLNLFLVDISVAIPYTEVKQSLLGSICSYIYIYTTRDLPPLTVDGRL